MFLMWVFLGLSALTALGTWAYLRRMESAGEKPSTVHRQTKTVKKETNPIPETWEIETVERGVIKLPNNCYRMICRIEAQDYYLLGQAGQDVVEDAAAAVLRQLNFPVQTVVTAATVDTTTEVALLRSRLSSLPPALAEVAAQRAAYLEARGRDRADTVRQAYMVLTWDAPREAGIEEAWAELMARAANLASGLEGARIRLEPLNTAGTLDLLTHFLRRGNPLPPSEAVAAGVGEYYSVWVKEVGR